MANKRGGTRSSTLKGYYIGPANERQVAAAPPTEANFLAEEITKLRAQGLTWAQIQVETGVDASECAIIASNYLKSSYEGTSITNARQLQIMRLEMLMKMLYDQVEAGDFLTQGRQTANLINTINSVTDLLDLKKDRQRDAETKLTEDQGGLLMHIIEAVKQHVIEDVMAMLTEHSTYNLDTGRRTVPDLGMLRAQLERDWGGWFASAADRALLEASENASDSTSEGTGDPGAAPSVPVQEYRPANVIMGEIERGSSDNIHGGN